MEISEITDKEQPLVKKSINFRIYFYVVLVVALISVAITVFMWVNRNRNINNIVTESVEVDDLVAQISKFLVLPTDEKPTVATVSDPSVLKDQPFFTLAKKGYKVLIYTNAKKAILYDPVSKKIVEVAPINLGADNNKTLK